MLCAVSIHDQHDVSLGLTQINFGGIMANNGTVSNGTLAAQPFKEQRKRYLKAALFEYRTSGSQTEKDKQRKLQKWSALIGLLTPLVLMVLAVAAYRIWTPLGVFVVCILALVGGMAGLAATVVPSAIQEQSPRVHNIVVGIAVITPMALVLLAIFGLDPSFLDSPS